MAHKKNNTNLTELLLQCVTQPDPMLSMLEWLCTQLMEAEVDQQLGARKISFSNMIERLNREIRRRTSVVGIFPNEASYVRLVTTYLMEYAENWSVSRAYLSQESIQATLLIAA